LFTNPEVPNLPINPQQLELLMGQKAVLRPSVVWLQATVRRRMPVDPQNAEALGRRVRALQKKLREIDKLKAGKKSTDHSMDISM